MRFDYLYRGREVVVVLNRDAIELPGKIEEADESGVTLLYQIDEDEEAVTVLVPMTSISFIEIAE